MDGNQAALINILEDFYSDKAKMENAQKAVLNILEDVNEDKALVENTQKAVLNILDDVHEDKLLVENTQKAVLNILEDYSGELERVEKMNTQLEHARNSLETRVEERTQELKKSNEELESFSYSVSHDLRAPLRAITGYSEILKEDYFDLLNEEGRYVIDTIVRNTKKMAALIDDILAFSRIGRQEIRKQVVNLSKLCTSVTEDLKDNIDMGTVQVHIDEMGDVFGDVTMLTQLMTNLISNAVKYSKPVEKPEVWIFSSEKEGQTVYHVKDNGVGFDDKYVKMAFGVFQRLHKERDFEGTGVGLAIAERVINNHKGKIWAKSKPGKGAEFFFII